MNGNVLFEIKDLQKKFGSLTVFDGLSETICKGDVTKDELELMCKAENVGKVSRRDFAIYVAEGRDGKAA